MKKKRLCELKLTACDLPTRLHIKSRLRFNGTRYHLALILSTIFVQLELTPDEALRISKRAVELMGKEVSTE